MNDDKKSKHDLRSRGFHDATDGRESAHDLLLAMENPRAAAYDAGFNMPDDALAAAVAAGPMAPEAQDGSFPALVSIPSETQEAWAGLAAEHGREPGEFLRAVLNQMVVLAFGRGPEFRDGKWTWTKPGE